MFVDADDAGRRALGVGFAQDFLPLQHHGQDIADVLGVVFLLIDQAAEQVLGALLFEGVGLLIHRGNMKHRLPEREGLLVVGTAALPGFEGEVFAEVTGRFRVREERGDDGFAVFERAFGGGAGAGAGSDVPGFG